MSIWNRQGHPDLWRTTKELPASDASSSRDVVLDIDQCVWTVDVSKEHLPSSLSYPELVFKVQIVIFVVVLGFYYWYIYIIGNFYSFLNATSLVQGTNYHF